MKLIGNGKVITRDEANPFLSHGAILIDKENIIEVGEYHVLHDKYPNCELIDAKGGVIMPGLINAHHHIYSAFARGLNMADNTPNDFLEILEKTWWKIDEKLTAEQSFHSGIATFIECVRNGVTTVIDHHASYGGIKDSLKNVADAADRIGLRACLAYEISDRHGVVEMRKALNENLNFINRVQLGDSPKCQALIGLHASFTLSQETLDICKQKNKNNVGYHIHVAEGWEDEKDAQEKYGCSVVERLHNEGILNEKSIAGHCIHVSTKDLKILKKSGVRVVHNPESNMANAVGSPKILDMLDIGIPVMLGTDGYTNDMLESLKVANLLMKHSSKIPYRGFDESIKMLFQYNAEGASALFETNIGKLKEGYVADIIIMEYKPFTRMDATNYNGHILFGMNGSMTETTIVNGEIIMKDRQIVKEKMNELLTECMLASKELWSELNE